LCARGLCIEFNDLRGTLPAWAALPFKGVADNRAGAIQIDHPVSEKRGLAK
jgi:hypothetical protein